MSDEDSAWWQIYTEGFAQWSESLIQGKPSWHMFGSINNKWLTWCQSNLSWLAVEFLDRLDNNRDLRPFFGSWYSLRGYKQTGYFLGYQLINLLHRRADLREIALLNEIETHLRPLLIELQETKRAYLK